MTMLSNGCAQTTTTSGPTMATMMARSASHEPIRSADGTTMYAQGRRCSAATGHEQEAPAASSSKPTSPLLSPHASMLAARRASSRSARLSQAMFNDGFYTPSYVSTAAATAAQASSPARLTPPGTASSSSYGFPSASSSSSQQQHFTLPIRKPRSETSPFPVDVDEDDFDFDVRNEEGEGVQNAYGGTAGDNDIETIAQDERMYSLSRLHPDGTHVTQRLSALSVESQLTADDEEELRAVPDHSPSHGSAMDSSPFSPTSTFVQRRHRRQRTQSTANSSCSNSSHSSMESDGSGSWADIKQATTQRATMMQHDAGGDTSGQQHASNLTWTPMRSHSDSKRTHAAPQVGHLDTHANPNRQRAASTAAAAEQPILLPEIPSQQRRVPSDHTQPNEVKGGGGGGKRGSDGQHFVTSLLLRRRSNSAAHSSNPLPADHENYTVVNQRTGAQMQMQAQTLPFAQNAVGSAKTIPSAAWSTAPVGLMTSPRDGIGEATTTGSEPQQAIGGGALSLLHRRARKISGSLQRLGQSARPRSASTSTNNSNLAQADMAAEENGGGGSSSGAHSPTSTEPVRTRKASLTLASLHRNSASPRGPSMSISSPAHVSPTFLLSAASMASNSDVTSEVLRAADAGAYNDQSPQSATAIVRSDSAYDVESVLSAGTPKGRGDSDATITKTYKGAAPSESPHQIRRKPVVPLPAYPPTSPSTLRAPSSPQGPGKIARVRLSSAAPTSATQDDKSAGGSGSALPGVLIPSNFGSSSSLVTPRSPNYPPIDTTATSEVEILNDSGRERIIGQPPPPPRSRRSGSLSRQRSGSRVSAETANPGNSTPSRNATASPLYAYTSTQILDAHRPHSATETSYANGSRKDHSPVGGISLQPPPSSNAGWTSYYHTNLSNESAATSGGGGGGGGAGSRTRPSVPSDSRSPNRGSMDTNTYSAPTRTGSSQGHRSTTTMGSSKLTSPAPKHENLSRQSWVGSSVGGHEAVEEGLQTMLNEGDVEIVEQDSMVTDTSDLYLVRRRIALELVKLGSKRPGSGLSLSSRASRTNIDADPDGDEHEQQESPLADTMFVGSEKERRKRREALEARERELTVEALSKAEIPYAHIEVWTESRKGRWIVSGPASDNADVAESLPEVPNPWAVPIDAKGIVRRKKLKSNVELSSSRTVMTCQDCREVAAMNIAHNCKTCAGSERVEMAYTVQCTVRHAHFLPLKLPAALLMGARQSHISYIDAADPDHRSDLLRDRALDGLQNSAARVVRVHNAQHGSRLLMGRVTISRCGVLSVSVKSSKNKTRRRFDVEDGADGKIAEVTGAAVAAASSSSSSTRPSAGRTSATGASYDRLAPQDTTDDAVSVRSNARTEHSAVSKGGVGGGGSGSTVGALLHRGKMKTLSFNRSSPNLQQDARWHASHMPPMPGAAGSGGNSPRLPGHQRNHSDDQTSALSYSVPGRETGKRSLKSLFR